jgi:hypothetical protein
MPTLYDRSTATKCLAHSAARIHPAGAVEPVEIGRPPTPTIAPALSWPTRCGDLLGQERPLKRCMVRCRVGSASAHYGHRLREQPRLGCSVVARMLARTPILNLQQHREHETLRRSEQRKTRALGH